MRGENRSWLLVAAVVLSATGYWIVVWQEATSPDVLRVAYATLSAFAGSYLQLEGQPDVPTRAATFFLLCALATTFAAAIAGVLNLTRGQLSRIEATQGKRNLIVYGDTAEADAIVNSLEEEERKRLVRIGEKSSNDIGSFALKPGRLIGDDPALVRVISNAAEAFLAGSDDGRNAQLRREISDANDGCQQYQLVNSPTLARALYPARLDTLPKDRIIHANDQVGQIVANLLSSYANRREQGVTISLIKCGVDPVGERVADWVENMAQARKYLNPTRPLSMVENPSCADLRVLVGEGERVVAELASDLVNVPTIAAASNDLIQALDLSLVRDVHRYTRGSAAGVLETGGVVVVDPLTDALSAAEIRKGISTQWGMAFDEAYRALFNPSAPQTLWNPNGRAEQSSVLAAQFMLENLRTSGYVLVRGHAGWIDGLPSDKALLALAEAEHNDWLERAWTADDGVKRPVTFRNSGGEWSPGPNAVQFHELQDTAKQYNLQVVGSVYPGLAAMFGYGIARLR